MRFQRIITSFLFITFSYSVFPQVFYGTESQNYIPDSRIVRIQKETGKISFIEFEAGKSFETLQAGENLTSMLGLADENTFRLVNETTDQLGITHTKYQQYYKGIPVVGAFYTVHSRLKTLNSANGEYFEVAGLETDPGISGAQAIEIATGYLGAAKYYWEFDRHYTPNPELVLLSIDWKVHLAFKLDIYSAEPLFRKFVYIDAQTGDVLKTVDRIHDEFHLGTAETKYEGTQAIATENVTDNYRLRNISHGIEIATYNMQHFTDYAKAVHFTDTDNYWDETDDQQDAATNAHFATEKTFEYFYRTYNRNSFDGEGSAMISYVNFGTQYINAFWNGNVFTYGDGDGYNYSALTAIEVVAHEITHAVTQYSAGLEYANESGALNESFSDIFGVAVDYYVNPLSFNYTMGEKFALLGVPFRNMANPKQYADPDTYKGEYWVNGSSDNGGVHTNSGVQNYWFYLLAEGGSGTNDLGNDYQVDGIGIEKAAAIAYRNLTVYLTPWSTYEDARFYSIQSANDLYGPCSAEVMAVTDAWYAAGLGEAFSFQVKADFRTSRNYSCNAGAEVEFFNTSSNASTFYWDFGDGTFSTESGPSHIYTEQGDYTVKLVAQGTDYCYGSDTIEKADLIRITDGISPVGAVCQPCGSYPDQFGISYFQLNSIDNSSDLADIEDSYVDFTCEFATGLVAGYRYPVNIQSGPQQKENVYIWLDLDNNGDFSGNELIFESKSTLKYHSGFVIIPGPDVYDTPLRLRVTSDHASFPVQNACASLHFGQSEDYTVILHPNTGAPVADFQLSDTIVSTGETVVLSDRSLNLPRSWRWHIAGISPGISQEQNPDVVFDTTGKYNVSLYVSNDYGADSIHRPAAVEVLNGFELGTDTSSGSKAGILYDSGGPECSYRNGEEYGFLIRPECAKTITLSFLAVNIEESYDNLYIYDGTDESGELLLKVTGKGIPEAVTAYSGSMFIRFVSDGAVNRDGFKAVWRAGVPENTPVIAGFSASGLNPAFYTEVHFTDLSQGSPFLWEWDFGDGIISGEQNPSHKFSSSGKVTISLYTSNCFHSDTLTREIIIQEVPGISLTDTAFCDTLWQGEIAENELVITNQSTSGELLYEISIHERLVTEVRQKSELYASDQYFTKENDRPACANDTHVSQSYKASQHVIPFSPTGLEWILDKIGNEYNELTDLIPGIYEFDGGLDGQMIADGGNDMYDGGNYLSTDLYQGIQYSNNEITSHTAFGAGGRYFTSKQPGLFLMAADLDNVASLSITGNLGADGYGEVDGSIITVTKGLQSYTGFVKRVSGAGDPSVNHLIIIPNAGYSASHTFNTNSNFDDHILFSLEQSNRLYYLLFSTLNGSYVPDSVMELIMEKFIQLVTPQCNWLVANEFSNSLGLSSSATISLFADATNLQAGNYSADIYIRSNDTLHNEIVVPFHLVVKEVLPPVLEVTDSVYIEIETGEIRDYELRIGNENGGSDLEYRLGVQEGGLNEEWLEIIMNKEGVVKAGSFVSSRLQVDARILEEGLYTGQLTVCSNDSVAGEKQVSVLLQVYENHLPLSDNTLEDIDTPVSGSINLYPNPATDILHIDLPSKAYEYVDVCVITVTGEILSQTKYNTFADYNLISVAISDLKAGVYILHITRDSGELYSFRFIKE